MKIKSIKAAAFKGSKIDEELTGLNLVVGPNGAGKTSVLEAVSVGCLGYLPKLGKRNGDTFSLSSGDGMSVIAVNDSGQKNTFIFQRDKKGTVKLKKTQEFVADADMISADDFLGMSPAKRIDYIFAKSGVEVDAQTAVNSLELPVELIDDDVAIKLLSEVCSSVERSFAENDSGQAILLADENISARLKTLRSETSTLSKTIEGLVGMSEDAPKDVSRELEKLQGEWDEVSKRASNNRVLLGERVKALDEIEEIRASIVEIESGDYLDDVNAELHRLGPLVDYGPAEEHLESLKTNLSARKTAYVVESTKLETLKREFQEAHELRDTFSAGCKCPTCKMEMSEHQQELFLDRMASDISLLKDQIEDAEKELEKITAEASGFQDDIRQQELVIKRERERNEAIRTVTGLKDHQVKKAESDLIALKRQLAECEKQAIHVDELKASIASDEKWMADREVTLLDLKSADEQRKGWIQNNRTREQAKLQLRTKEIEFAAMKGISESFAKFKAQCVDGAFEGVFAVANKLVGSVTEGCRLSYSDGEIALVRPSGDRISPLVACGSEFAAIYAGLCAGISKGGIMFLDEMSRFDPQVCGRIIRAVEELLAAGLISQFIGAHCGAGDVSALKNWNVINVGGES